MPFILYALQHTFAEIFYISEIHHIKQSLCLVCRTKQIVYSFHRIKCFYRDLYKNGVPVTHRSVPQSRQAPTPLSRVGF